VADREREAALTRSATVGLLDALAGRGGVAGWLAPAVELEVTETGEVTRGREAVAALLAYLHRQAFAATPVVRSLVVTPDLALAEVEFVATHVGEFAGVAATGRKVRVAYALACEVAGGRIVALRAYMPLDALLRQIR